MKKFTLKSYTRTLTCLTAMLSLAMATNVSAQQFRVLEDITDSDGNGYKIWGQSISPNHKYVAGLATSKTDGKTGCFVYDLETGKSAVLPGPGDLGGDIRGVNDNGVAAGCNPNALLLSIDGTKTDLETPENYESAAWDLDDTGNTAVGSYWSIIDYTEHACIWKDGKMVKLPEPTSEEMGFNVWGTSANYCSGDASVIVGYITDDLVTRPFIMWTLQDDGTYKLNTTICKEYFGKYTDDMSKPYVMFYPSNVSRNGRYVSLTVARDGSECRMARYDITTGEIEEYVADGSGTITAGMGSESLAAANDGTIAGNLMSSNQLVPYGRCACLWLPSAAEPVQLSSAYSEYQELAVYDEIGYNRLYDITPDGKMGLGLAYDEMYDYATYVIDLENITSSIDKVQAGEQDDSETERYTIDGTKISAPVKGLNIVKKADGTVVKVMVK